MARLTNLHQAFHRVAAERTVEDPWGNGIRFLIKRAGSAWQTAVRELQMLNPYWKKIQIAQGQKLAGSRKELVFSDEELKGLSGSEQEKQAKAEAKAIATHLLAGWEGLLDEEGEPVEFSVDEAVALLTNEEFGIPRGLEVPEDQVADVEARSAADPPDPDFAASFYRDPDTHRWMERVPHGGQMLGPALRYFLIEEARKLESFYQDSKKGLTKN